MRVRTGRFSEMLDTAGTGRRRMVAAFAATVMAVSTAIVLGGGTEASAASGCWKAGFTKTVTESRCCNIVYDAYYCYNETSAPVYSYPGGGVVGHLWGGTNWYVCRDQNPENPYVGGPHPRRWEYTEADNRHWGWVKDTEII